jgi:predicted nucleotidyltransferase
MNAGILKELTGGILDILGEKVREIILYGSFARQTASEDSDVDVAVLIYEPINRKTEDKLSDFIVDMNLKYNKVFSVMDIDCNHFDAWINFIPFYQNVKKEGVSLWKAA